jgi:hypothetical protein
MDGMMLSWLVTGLVGLALLLLLAIAAVLLPCTVRLLTSRTACPWAGRTVEVQTLVLDGHDPIAVVSCTAFADRRAVSCGMPCIGGDHRASLAGDRGVTARLGD